VDINYTYHKTSNIETNLVKIEVAKRIIDLLPTLPHIEEFLRRRSLLKSSLFSAKIEGNKLQLPKLIRELIAIIKKREHAAIKAAIAHFVFEKIHPFLDGNGRVGRLISTFILKNSGYGFRELVVLEEYLSNHREEYYDLLAVPKKDITDFVEFFTEAVARSAEKAVDELQETKEDAKDSLLPRRQEILAIIKDHKMVSFNFIKRRFQKVPDSSLHYDIKTLINKAFIKKLGTTRGALYSPK